MDKKNKQKMTGIQIFRLITSIVASGLALGGFVLGFISPSFTGALKFLPIPMLVVSIIALLILKTTGKYSKVADGEKLEEQPLEETDDSKDTKSVETEIAEPTCGTEEDKL